MRFTRLVSEKGSTGRRLDLTSPCDVPQVSFKKTHIREKQLHLPHLPKNEAGRHYTELAKRSHGIDDGFYPLGSCTMKYNSKMNRETTALKGFRGVYPLQPETTVQGSMEVLCLVEKYLYRITGMDAMTFQPAAGVHGEFTGLPLIKAYHVRHNDTRCTRIIIPDSAHGTNPASAVMCGHDVMNISLRKDGYVNLEQLEAAVENDTAGLMLTSPDTVGLFDKNILEMTRIVYDVDGLCYCDGANLDMVTSIARPSGMGLDVIHLSLHKTFSISHGGGESGSGPVGYKEFLKPFIPGVRVEEKGDVYHFVKAQESIEDMKMFYGNFPVVIKALTYILTLGREDIPEAARNVVLSANYMKVRLSGVYDTVYNKTCMYEFVMSLGKMRHDEDTNTMNIVKVLLNHGIHPPAMHFPLIVHEVLTVEPTGTESKGTPDEAVEVLHRIYEQTLTDPEALHNAPHLTPTGRPDKITAARKPVLRYTWE